MVPTSLRRTPASDPSAAARIMFERMLAAWAMDVLALRRRGLDRPGRRGVIGLAPAAPPAEDAPIELSPDAA